MPVEEAYGEARSVMNAAIEHDVRRDIGGDQQRIGQIETDVGRLSFKHVLLPVWLAAYRYRGKSFRFVVNGRTGTVQGERPYSSVKIAIAIAIALVIAGLIAYAADRAEITDGAPLRAPRLPPPSCWPLRRPPPSHRRR